MQTFTNYSRYILAFGAHPDDVEVGAGGVIATTSAEGRRNIIIDMSPSQMASHGTPQQRLQEAQQAARVLGVAERINLGLEDTKLQDDEATRLLVARQIRTYKPEIVLIPWIKDRHPDHETTAQVVKNGIFLAGLPKISLDGLAPHRPRLLLHYMIWQEIQSDVIIPLSDEMFARKMQAFRAYRSQHETNEWGEEYLCARHLTHGRRIGSRYGEGFKVSSDGVGVSHFDHLRSGFF